MSHVWTCSWTVLQPWPESIWGTHTWVLSQCLRTFLSTKSKRLINCFWTLISSMWRQLSICHHFQVAVSLSLMPHPNRICTQPFRYLHPGVLRVVRAMQHPTSKKIATACWITGLMCMLHIGYFQWVITLLLYSCFLEMPWNRHIYGILLIWTFLHLSNTEHCCR